MFCNTVTTNDKYPFGDWEYSSHPIQLQWSWRPKTFAYSCFFFVLFFCYFSNLHQILNLLKKKIIVIATFLRNVQALKDLVRPHSKKPYFRTPFYSQHVKVSHTLVKSEWELFHHIFSSLWENWLEKFLPLWYVKS